MELNRRDFLKNATILGGAAALAGLTGCASSAGADSDITWADETDVVVVGGGCAGWAATYEATNAGAKVICIEKNPGLGGDMGVCAGELPGYDTEFTKAAGVTATADQLWEEYIQRGENPHGLPPQDVVEYIFRNCGENIDFMADAGVEWYKMDLHPWYSKYDIFFQARYGDLKGGAAFVEPLAKSMKATGAKIMVETRGKNLITDETGRVIGITAEKDGKELNIKARKAVILATGGYTGNSKLVGAFAEQWSGIAGSGIKTNIGDGLQMAMELGAITTRTQDGGFVLPNSEYNTGNNINADCLYSGFMVDATGKRCINDGASYATTALADEFQKQFARQKEDYLWLVVDSSPDTVGYYENEVKVFHPTFLTADTLEELAGQMGVDPKNLAETAAKYSQYARSGVDPEFGRTANMHVVEVPPFHAVKMAPSVVMTTGGLKANMECRVLRMKNTGEADSVKPADETSVLEAIPGLFAAGMLVEWCAFTGWSCTSCFTLGRIAGQKAAAEASWEKAAS